MNERSWLVLAIALVVWLLFCCIIGAIAQRKGRSFLLWTFSPTLMIIGLVLLGGLMSGTYSESWSKWAYFVILYLSPVIWVGLLIAVLIAGKTHKKRMQEIAEEERVRQSVARRYTNRAPQQSAEFSWHNDTNEQDKQY